MGFLLVLLLSLSNAAFAQTTASSVTKKVPTSHLYISLSDAMDASKRGDSAAATQSLKQIQAEFEQIESHNSAAGQVVSQTLSQAIAAPDEAHLSAVSNALYAFEQEQNPVDYTAKREEFKRRIMPAYEELNRAIAQAKPEDAESLRLAYQKFNAIWVASERVVRNTSMGHYGAIETAMALMRVAIETQPLDLNKVQKQSEKLKQALDSYNSGQTMAATSSAYQLSDGLQLLRDGLTAFQGQNIPEGQDKLTQFIEIWPSIEGDVSTRDPNLYNQIESQIPVILAHGEDPNQQQQLQKLINQIAQIDPQAQYTAIDAMLILLREGLEALLIVMALISALNVAQQEQGKKWIYTGVIAGLIASVLGALALQKLFPVATAGSNREFIEGIIGVITVAMMLVVGAWLHSKSSLHAWNAYIKKHMGKALTTGSLLSLFGLSFLSVFREGAETILFYAGILPKISTSSFISGIVMAVLVLGIIAILLFKTSLKLPIAKMFKVLTWVIYALGFKILGVSIHALQLTSYLPMTSLRSQWLEVSVLGIYPTVETLCAQAIYIVIVILIQRAVHRSNQKLSAPASA